LHLSGTDERKRYHMTRKLLFAFTYVLLTAIVTLGQVKDEPFNFQRNPDPIKSVSIFPNPAIEFVSVKFEAPVAKQVRLTVHNVIGNTMELESEVVDEHEIKIRIKDLATGYYLISVKDERLNLSNTYKFLKR
jgi:Secretion system C-terminal sorting domain